MSSRRGCGRGRCVGHAGRRRNPGPCRSCPGIRAGAVPRSWPCVRCFTSAAGSMTNRGHRWSTICAALSRSPACEWGFAGQDRVADRVAVHRAAFPDRSSFTADLWTVMSQSPAYRHARCLGVGYDDQDNAVAAATVWSVSGRAPSRASGALGCPPRPSRSRLRHRDHPCRSFSPARHGRFQRHRRYPDLERRRRRDLRIRWLSLHARSH